MHKNSVYDTDSHFEIDPITRAISNKSTSKTKIIQGDHNSERFTFEIPRCVDGHDMTCCDKIEVHYINVASNKEDKNSDVYIADDMQVSPDDENVVIFSWLISGNATVYEGTLNFLVKFKCLSEEKVVYVWSTEIHDKIMVSRGIDIGEEVIVNTTDVLEAWKKEVFGDLDAALDAILEIQNELIGGDS